MAAAVLLCICFKIKLEDGGIPDINGGGVFEFDLSLCVEAAHYFGFLYYRLNSPVEEHYMSFRYRSKGLCEMLSR